MKLIGEMRDESSVSCSATELSHSVPAEEEPVFTIRATRGWRKLNLLELWRSRELIWFLTWRDIQLRYRQTALGAAWAVLQPVAAMAIFTLLFGRFAKLPSDGKPYAIFVFCGLIPWQLFAYSLTEASRSVVASQNIVTKVYFPRAVIPISATLSGLVDFFVSFVVLVALMLWFRVVPTTAIVFLPLFVLLALISALGIGLWLAALNVHYRDVRYTIPFLTQIWFFATPVLYSSQMIPEPWRTWLGLNPMAGVVEGFRWALLGTTQPTALVWVSACISLIVFYTGLLFFRSMERRFADVI